MATGQEFDNGIMLAYRDIESGGNVIFALYDHGQWSQWHDDGLLRSEALELKVPAGALRMTDTFTNAWDREKLSGTMGYASKQATKFAGSWRRQSDGGHRITDNLGRVLLLKKNGLQTWRFLRMSRTDDFLSELEY